MIGPKDFFPLLDFAFMPNNSLSPRYPDPPRHTMAQGGPGCPLVPPWCPLALSSLALPQPAGAAAAPLPPPEGAGPGRPARGSPAHLLPLLPLPSHALLHPCHEEGGEPSRGHGLGFGFGGRTDMCCHRDGDGRAGSCCLLPGSRSHQIIEWFGWEGPLKTIQFHPPLWAGVLQLCWVPQGWVAVLGYSSRHGVSGVLGRGSHVTTCCAPSPAPDLHEPVPEPGPTELQRLEAALHQTPCSVQVSAD